MVLPSATKHQVVTATVCSILLSAIIWLCGQRYFVEPLVRQVDAFRRERPPVLHTVQLSACSYVLLQALGQQMKMCQKRVLS